MEFKAEEIVDQSMESNVESVDDLVVKEITMDTHVMAHLFTILVHVIVALVIISSIKNGRHERAKSAGYFLLILSVLALIPILSRVDKYIIRNPPE